MLAFGKQAIALQKGHFCPLIPQMKGKRGTSSPLSPSPVFLLAKMGAVLDF